MRPTFYYPFFLLLLLFSCKASQDADTRDQSRPVRSDLKFKENGKKLYKEPITKSACRIEGIIINDNTSQASSPVLMVNEFLGEGAAFITYKPQKGDRVEIKGLENHSYEVGDTLRIEIQTMPEKANKPVQKAGLIKILDL